MNEMPAYPHRRTEVEICSDARQVQYACSALQNQPNRGQDYFHRGLCTLVLGLAANMAVPTHDSATQLTMQSPARQIKQHLRDTATTHRSTLRSAQTIPQSPTRCTAGQPEGTASAEAGRCALLVLHDTPPAPTVQPGTARRRTIDRPSACRRTLRPRTPSPEHHAASRHQHCHGVAAPQSSC